MKTNFVIPNRSAFVSERKTISIEERIKTILWYVVECYLLILKNKEKYSKTWVKNKTSYGYKFENYLRTRLVDDYLNKYKYLLKQKTLGLNEINFTKESEEEYSDNNKIEIDKIDIYVNNLGFQKKWQRNSEPYFAIECKRIEKLADTGKYISDIQKFCNRNHIKTRLPFEGQIAFIENTEITHIQLKEKINDKLQPENYLNTILINDKYDATYLSKHKRNSTSQNFSIYHLLFDYSGIVIN